MGNNIAIYKEYNNENKLSINFTLNKVCYFPEEYISGTITLFPTSEIIEQLMANPELIITLQEFQKYEYSITEDSSKFENKNYILINTKINFKDSLQSDNSSGIEIPFSFEIPKLATPTIFYSSYNDYIRHFLSVEVPICEAKRTKLIIIKNVFPKNKLLRGIEKREEFNKTKSLSKKKCSVICEVKIPKNYFFYDEEIPFEINIYFSNSNLKIKSIKVYIERKENFNKKEGDYITMKKRRAEIKEINYKKINLEKGLSKYNIVNSIKFPISSIYFSVYPLEVYEKCEKHGLYEVNDIVYLQKNFQLYPSNLFGLLTVEYYLRFKFHFDSFLTSDENIKIPLYFSENNKYNPTQCIDQ